MCSSDSYNVFENLEEFVKTPQEQIEVSYCEELADLGDLSDSLAAGHPFAVVKIPPNIPLACVNRYLRELRANLDFAGLQPSDNKELTDPSILVPTSFILTYYTADAAFNLWQKYGGNTKAFQAALGDHIKTNNNFVLNTWGDDEISSPAEAMWRLHLKRLKEVFTHIGQAINHAIAKRATSMPDIEWLPCIQMSQARYRLHAIRSMSRIFGNTFIVYTPVYTTTRNLIGLSSQQRTGETQVNVDALSDVDLLKILQTECVILTLTTFSDTTCVRNMLQDKVVANQEDPEMMVDSPPIPSSSGDNMV